MFVFILKEWFCAFTKYRRQYYRFLYVPTSTLTNLSSKMLFKLILLCLISLFFRVVLAIRVGTTTSPKTRLFSPRIFHTESLTTDVSIETTPSTTITPVQTEPTSPLYPLHIDIVKSAILSFAPWLELHHIVVLRDPACATKGLYTIDFSPKDYTDPETLSKMMIGKSVPGELRVRWIPKERDNMDEIKHKCMVFDSKFFDDLRIDHTGHEHQKLSKDHVVEMFIHHIKQKWDTRINMYNHNCQHFSHFVLKEAKQQFKLI